MKQKAYCAFCHNLVEYDFELGGGQGGCSQNAGGCYAYEPISLQMGRSLVKSFKSNPKRSRKVLRRR